MSSIFACIRPRIDRSRACPVRFLSLGTFAELRLNELPAILIKKCARPSASKTAA
jgi:hypothetical protein